MKDQNEDFEDYLRQFRLRPGNTRALIPRPANRPQRWWISGIAATFIAAAVIARLKRAGPF